MGVVACFYKPGKILKVVVVALGELVCAALLLA